MTRTPAELQIARSAQIVRIKMARLDLTCKRYEIAEEHRQIRRRVEAAALRLQASSARLTRALAGIHS